jgi:hypothetical protein
LNTGSAHVRVLTPKETAVVDSAIDALREVATPLSFAIREYVAAIKALQGKADIVEAAKFYYDHLVKLEAKGELKRIKVPELVTAFIKDIEGKSLRYRYDMNARLTKFAKAFKVEIATIETSQIDEWLSGMKGLSPRTKNNFRASVITLFSYAGDKKYLPRDKKTEAEFSNREAKKRF